MGMNIVEKILAKASGSKRVAPGETVWVDIDLAITDDLCLPLLKIFEEEIKAKKVWDPDKILILFDHMVPATTEKAANDQIELREFCDKHSVRFYEIGHPEHGIMTSVAHEQGLARPGMVVVATDSHTPILGAYGLFGTGIGFTEMAVVFATGKTWFRVPQSLKFNLVGKLGERIMGKDVILKIIGDLGTTGALYKALEFDGPGLENISIDGRMTMCCMACEAGGKTGIMPPREDVVEYVRERTSEPFSIFSSDPDAKYERQYEYDLNSIVPLVAVPPNVDDVRPAHDLKGIKINQVFIGSCTNAKTEDLRVAAEILKGKHVHPKTRVVITPVSQPVYKHALEKGWINIFAEAGAAVTSPTCGACIGGHAGLLGKGEVCASTGNRNWIGRMGSKEAQVYMMSPATAAASAIRGEICDPRDI